MSFRSCCKFAGAVPRLLWGSKFTVPPGTFNLVGRNPACGVASTYLGCKREFYPYVVYLRKWCSSLSCFEWFNALYVYYLLYVLLLATVLLLRRFSSSPPSTDVTYEQLKVLLAGQKSTVIDVREPWELREYGVIPGSINVPCECFIYFFCVCVCMHVYVQCVLIV